ncbi:hypothetical protein EVAR_76924_1 [Eumeta japonica]|uniref:Uncharacterized protein n=1 Tax=Eumeta variegata TaxID=151549 RepID=A0A4C1SEY0_EUMVA|nr:hypothetical protein EVAR_76924_1 [Eumeta japonica]
MNIEAKRLVEVSKRHLAPPTDERFIKRIVTRDEKWKIGYRAEVMFNFIKKSGVLPGGGGGEMGADDRDAEKERRKREKKERKEKEKKDRVAAGLEEPLRLEESRIDDGIIIIWLDQTQRPLVTPRRRGFSGPRQTLRDRCSVYER